MAATATPPPARIAVPSLGQNNYTRKQSYKMSYLEYDEILFSSF